MPKIDDVPNGAPVWIDLATSDTDRARAFYGELFGWTSEQAGEDMGGYVTYSLGGVPVAGGMRCQEGQPDTWSVYLRSDDAAATLTAAEAHGGTVVMPAMPIPGVGTMAVVVDPGGATVAVWQPAEHHGFGVLAEPGAPAWFELHTRSFPQAVQFYEDVFAWDAHAVSDTDEFRYTTLGEGDDQRAGVMDASAYLPASIGGEWTVYFQTDDIAATLARVEELGGKVEEPAMDTPYGTLARCLDPMGASFKLQQP